jgi:hypothetical protein
MRMLPPASVCLRPGPAAIRRRAAILLLATLCPLSWERAASQAPSEETVTEVWVHDVPGPPEGDFWDPVSQHLLSVFTNPASVYPDVMVCARPLAGGKPTCTRVCWDLQGDTKLGGKLRSQECRLPLRVRLPAANHGMQLEVLEMDEVGGRPQVHATIARNIAVTDPLTCPHEKPCEMKLAKGSLVLSFGTQHRTAAESAAAIEPKAGCTAPSRDWGNLATAADLKGLHGPYASVEEAMRLDWAGYYAWVLTDNAEFGFLIGRDKRQPVGGYYTTPPVRSTDTSWNHPRLLWKDYMTSRDRALSGSCQSADDFVLVATVHTHPLPLLGSWTPCFLDNFSMADFTQATQLFGPGFEEIVMINLRDRKVRVFAPQAGDKPFSQDEIDNEAALLASLLGLVEDKKCGRNTKYDRRVQVIGHYPENQQMRMVPE